ncbi:hypothetical protein SH528x_002132 [Novipirellula sp. SH528]|uniref:hypothetical protein n=1 Tax=Novipirellula sp. SH528 TaxID=3454466 RepID=UPI003FA0DA18
MNTARQLGQTLFDVATSASGDADWQTVKLDARFDGNGGIARKIFVTQVRSGADELCPPAGDTIDLPLAELDKHRSGTGTAWFGLLYTVTCNGEVKIDLSYDHEIAYDPAFRDCWVAKAQNGG